MTTDLRLLLDECLQAELAEEIKKWGKVHAEWACDIPGIGGAGVTDDVLMEYAQEKKRILVTVERRINERRFAICTHRGIIVFKAAKRHETVKAQIFQKFMLSGERKHARHAVTYLTQNSIIFRHRDANGKIVDTIIHI